MMGHKVLDAVKANNRDVLVNLKVLIMFSLISIKTLYFLLVHSV